MHRRLSTPLRTLLSLSVLLFLVLVSPCHVSATSNGAVSQSDTPTETKRALWGSISVHLALSPYKRAGAGSVVSTNPLLKQDLSGVGVGTWGSVDPGVFDKDVNTYQRALERAIADSGLF